MALSQEHKDKLAAGRLAARQAKEQAKLGAISMVRSEKDRPTEQIRSEGEREEQVREVTQRREIIPFGVARAKLGVTYQIPGHHLHWINDYPGRVHQAQQGGYDFVHPKEVSMSTGVAEATDLGTKVRRLVGKQESGDALYAFLMKIPLELYEQTQAMIQAEVDRTDQAIRAGAIGPNKDNANGYRPKVSLGQSSVKVGS